MKKKLESIPWPAPEKGWSAKIYDKSGANSTSLSFRKVCIVLDNVPELKKWAKEILKEMPK